jgi:hypothetical protein
MYGGVTEVPGILLIGTREEKKTWQRRYSWCRVEN